MIGKSLLYAVKGAKQVKTMMSTMDLVMPLMTLWMSSSFSGMLGVYWIYQSLLGILQTFVLFKAMPLPKQP